MHPLSVPSSDHYSTSKKYLLQTSSIILNATMPAANPIERYILGPCPLRRNSNTLNCILTQREALLFRNSRRSENSLRSVFIWLDDLQQFDISDLVAAHVMTVKVISHLESWCLGLPVAVLPNSDFDDKCSVVWTKATHPPSLKAHVSLLH